MVQRQKTFVACVVSTVHSTKISAAGMTPLLVQKSPLSFQPYQPTSLLLHSSACGSTWTSMKTKSTPAEQIWTGPDMMFCSHSSSYAVSSQYIHVIPKAIYAKMVTLQEL